VSELPAAAIRTLIVDDEPIARSGLRELLDTEKDFIVVGEAGDGPSAAEEIISKKPDVVFLDIQMPEVDGFGVVEAVGPAEMPPVVFVTAFDEYAVKAFEIHALDYLLKPVDPDRFRNTAARIRRTIAEGGGAAPGQDVLLALRGLPGSGAFPRRLLVRSAEKIIVVDAASIEWVTADGDYVRIRTKGATLTTRSTMASMEGRLDPSKFARIHRSSIINIGLVRELRPAFTGDHVVLLQDGTKFTLSRTYKSRLFSLLGHPPAV